MDGKDCHMDDIFIERFWMSIKQKDLFLKDYENINELKNR